MAETKKEKPEELATSEEMINFYRALATVQTNSICRVMRGKDAKDIKKRAKKETQRLLEAAVDLPGGRQCPPGTVWDELLRKCV